MRKILTIERIQRRHDVAYERAQGIKLWIDENVTLNSDISPEIIKKYRMMNELFREATTIAICLESFRESCYVPMGPLV